MATGRFFGVELPAKVNTTVYTVPTGKQVVFTLNACNSGSKTVLLRIAFSAAATPVAGDWVEYDASISSAATVASFVRDGLVLGPGMKIIAYANESGLNLSGWGYEEPV